MNKLFIAVAVALVASSVGAAPRTVRLSVPTMNCPVCPITVKKALTKVPGVSRAQVNYNKRLAIVAFDDTKTGVDALTKATKDAGYPSTFAGNAK